MYPLVPKKFSEEEMHAVVESMSRDQWTMGSSVRKFEAEFAKSVGMKYAVMVNSGSSANLVAVTSFFFCKERPLKRGDEVLVPAVAWATTWAPLWQLGLKVRVVDVDLDTLNVSAESFRKAITPATKMIIAVSILGNPCELEAIRDLCRERGLHFMEDNCESLGATVKGKQAGTFGEVNTFSFYYSHHISTIEGGMICMDSEDFHQLSVSLRAHGWTRDLSSGSSLLPSKLSPFAEAYRFLYPGYNVRPLELTGAIGLVQLKKLPQTLSDRKDNARQFCDMMKKHPRIRIQKELHGQSTWFAFTLLLPKEFQHKRDRMYEFFRSHDIDSRMITGGNFLRHEMSQLFDLSVANGAAPNADLVHDCGLFVANHDVPLGENIQKLDHVLTQFEKEIGL